MSNKPIEMLFDQAAWTALPPQPEGELPHVTHQGVLNLAGFELHVFQLSNGQRVIDEKEMARLFGFDDPAAFRNGLENLLHGVAP